MMSNNRDGKGQGRVYTFIILLIVFLLLSPKLGKTSLYTTYAKLNSGTNLLSIYSSATELERKGKSLYLSGYGQYGFDGNSYYGYILGAYAKYFGELSISYVERDKVELVGIKEKESAYNISYGNTIGIFGFVLSANIIDAFHMKSFEITKDFLYSWSIGLSLKPSSYILIEAGVLDFGKQGASKSSVRIKDAGEYVYAGVSLFILNNLLFRFTSHIFRGNRVKIGAYLRYSILEELLSFESLFTNEPLGFGIFLKVKTKYVSLRAGFMFEGKAKYSGIFGLSVYLASSSSAKIYKGIPELEGEGRGGDGKEGGYGIKGGGININTASQKELMKLPGVGVKTSARIIEYRKKHGGYGVKEDILNVEGIGSVKFGKIRPYISVGEEEPLKSIDNWKMKDFIKELDFSALLSRRLELYIKANKPIRYPENLLMVEGFEYKELKKLKERLRKYGVKEE